MVVRPRFQALVIQLAFGSSRHSNFIARRLPETVRCLSAHMSAEPIPVPSASSRELPVDLQKDDDDDGMSSGSDSKKQEVAAPPYAGQLQSKNKAKQIKSD